MNSGKIRPLNVIFNLFIQFVPTHIAVLTVHVLVSIFNVSFFSIVGASEHS